MTFSLVDCRSLSLTRSVSPLPPSLLSTSLLFPSPSLSLSLPPRPFPPSLPPKVLEETLRCDTTMAASFAAIGSHFDYIADVKEDL